MFDKERFYVFSGERDAVDVLTPPPPLVPAARSHRRRLRSRRAAASRAEHAPREPDKLEVQLKLVAVGDRRGAA